MSMRHILALGPDFLTNVQEGDSQPNAVDLRVQDVFKLNDTEFRLEGDNKTHRGSEKILVEIIHPILNKKNLENVSRNGKVLKLKINRQPN